MEFFNLSLIKLDELLKSKLKPHIACPETAKVQMMYIKEEEEGSILDLGIKNCTRITKETPRNSRLTARTAANGCRCFWSLVTCPQVLFAAFCFFVFLQLRRCHESRLLCETKCAPLTEAHRCLRVGEDETRSFRQEEGLWALHQSHPRSGRFCTAHTGDQRNKLAAHIQLKNVIRPEKLLCRAADGTVSPTVNHRGWRKRKLMKAPGSILT